MAESIAKLPIKTEEKTESATPKLPSRRPLDSLRREVDRLFEDFDSGSWLTPFRRLSADIEPFWREYKAWGASPAVDFVEKEHAYEVTAELPGLDEKNIEVKVAGGGLTIKGEKQEDKEEKKKDYYLHERHFGSFERYFRVPEGVDVDKIEATFKKGILKVTLPKVLGAQKSEKKIEVKTT